MSNEANLEFYECVMDGIKDYHSTVLPDIKVNGMVLTAPPKVQIDRNNFDIPLRSKKNVYNVYFVRSLLYYILFIRDIVIFNI